ncbi:MAG: serine/threonine protein kinase [Cognaticolwellia sp.]|jgi:serine/threonine protein kinase
MSTFKPRLIKNTPESSSGQEKQDAGSSKSSPVRIRLRAAGEQIPPRQEGQVYNGRFRLQTCLERRGGVEKWLALQEPMVRRVLLEVLTESGERSDAFLMDASALAATRHESLAAVYDLGRAEDGSAWRSSEVMHGFVLREVLNQGPLARSRLRAMVRDVADGVAELHNSGVMHGNLSAEAVLLEQDVDDDELARVTAYGTHGAQNPSLRTPENEVGTMAADVYAMGLLFHQAATGKRPVGGKVHPSVPEFLLPVIRKCLADVDERYPDALAVRAALPFRSVVAPNNAPPPPMIMPTTTLGPATSEIKVPALSMPAPSVPAPPAAAAKAPASQVNEPRSDGDFDHPWVIAILSGMVAGLVSALLVQALTG